jgi:hypothetical protein
LKVVLSVLPVVQLGSQPGELVGHALEKLVELGEVCFHLVELDHDLGVPFSGLLLAVVEVGHGYFLPDLLPDEASGT